MSQSFFDRLKKIVLLCLATFFGILILPIFTPAQGSYQLEYRITQLESQISDLRSQISRLQVSGSGVNRSSQSPAGSNRTTGRTLSGDPMFDNLATLAIELKQDVIQIKERLSQLEASQTPPRNR